MGFQKNLKAFRKIWMRFRKIWKVRGGANATIGEFKFIGSFTTARAMTITGLIAGTTYAFSVRAVGSSNRYSDWSDPVAHMCM